MTVSLQGLEALAPSDAEQELIWDAVRSLWKLRDQARGKGLDKTASGQMILEFLADMLARLDYSTILRLELAKRRKREASS